MVCGVKNSHNVQPEVPKAALVIHRNSSLDKVGFLLDISDVLCDFLEVFSKTETLCLGIID